MKTIALWISVICTFAFVTGCQPNQDTTTNPPSSSTNMNTNMSTNMPATGSSTNNSGVPANTNSATTTN